jgi:hypothetical protein
MGCRVHRPSTCVYLWQMQPWSRYGWQCWGCGRLLQGYPNWCSSTLSRHPDTTANADDLGAGKTWGLQYRRRA